MTGSIADQRLKMMTRLALSKIKHIQLKKRRNMFKYRSKQNRACINPAAKDHGQFLYTRQKRVPLSHGFPKRWNRPSSKNLATTTNANELSRPKTKRNTVKTTKKSTKAYHQHGQSSVASSLMMVFRLVSLSSGSSSSMMLGSMETR